MYWEVIYYFSSKVSGQDVGKILILILKHVLQMTCLLTCMKQDDSHGKAFSMISCDCHTCSVNINL